MDSPLRAGWGSLMDRELNEAHEFIELLANNEYGWVGIDNE